MFEENCGAVPVVENYETMKPVGMITDRDITVNTVAFGKDPLHMMAAEIMSYPVLTVQPEATVDNCCVLMEENKVRRMIVVDNLGRLCGIVAQADIARRAPRTEVFEMLRDISAPPITEAV
jgi:CBS domain-containing protein